MRCVKKVWTLQVLSSPWVWERIFLHVRHQGPKLWYLQPSLSGEPSAPLAKQTWCHYRRGQLDLSRLQSSGLSSRLCILVYSVIIPNDLLKWPPHSKDPPWPNTVVTIGLLRWNSLPLESCECESTLQAGWCIKVSGFSFSTRFSILRCNENFLACQELRAQPTKHRDDIKCRIWETPKLNICFPWLYRIIRPAGNMLTLNLDQNWVGLRLMVVISIKSPGCDIIIKIVKIITLAEGELCDAVTRVSAPLHSLLRDCSSSSSLLPPGPLRHISRCMLAFVDIF